MSHPSTRVIAHNLRRIMADEAMTYEDVVEATRLDARTIRCLARGEHQPQARTIHRLAEGLGVATDELFTPPTGLSHQAFDAATNPVVGRLRERRPEIFADWAAEDFAELASRFGIGGELTEAGAIAETDAMNAKRAVVQRVKVILETSHRQLLSDFVEVLYDRVEASA